MYKNQIGSPFPILYNDIAMRAAVEHKPEIRFMDQEDGSVICSYIVSCDGTFDEMYSREARGIVFDINGKVISRPLHKFSNLNQNPENQYQNIDWSKAKRIMTKRDGSMIHQVAITSDSWALKSKKSYSSDVAVQATKFVNDSKAPYDKFLDLCVKKDVTAIFEWTSPVARIVVGYLQDSLTLLHIRDNVTGKYFTEQEIKEISEPYKIPLVEEGFLDILETIKNGKVQELIDSTEGIEGWVIQFENGDMIKIKTKWYMDRHHAMTFLRVRDIAEMTLKETLDDLKSILVAEGCDISEINTIENKVVEDIDLMITEVQTVYEQYKHLSRKDFAITLGNQGQNLELFKLIMHKYEGKEPDYKAFYERNYLHTRFDLRQINLLQSTAETE